MFPIERGSRIGSYLLSLTLLLTGSSFSQEPNGSGGPGSSSWYAYIMQNAEYDPALDALYATYIEDAAINEGGQLFRTSETASLFEFPSERMRDSFLVLMDSPQRVPGTGIRYRDLVGISEDLVRETSFAGSPNDPKYVNGKQCSIDLAKVVQGWDELPANVDHVIIAVIDRGIDPSHPELLGQLVVGHNLDDPSMPLTDPEDHGTAVSGIIAARSNNSMGIVGCAPPTGGNPLLSVMPLQATNLDTIEDAIHWAVAHGAQVINISQVSDTPSEGVATAIQNAVDSGVVVVACAGNNGQQGAKFPASHDEVLSVGGQKCAGQLWVSGSNSGSNWGDEVLIGAPAEGFQSLKAYGGYKWVEGTSFAAPYVAGLAGLIRGILPLATSEDISEYILKNTSPIPFFNVFDKPFVHGAVNFRKAIKAAAQALPIIPDCPPLPQHAAKRIKTHKNFKHNFFTGGLVPLNFKKEGEQCLAVHSIAAYNDNNVLWASPAFGRRRTRSSRGSTSSHSVKCRITP